MAGEGTRDFVRVVVGTFLPPLGVFLQVGFGLHFWINLLLVFLGGLPGVIHALWVVATVGPGGRPQPDGTTTFVALLAATLLPPLGIAMKKGVGGALLLNVLLCFFFWFPAILHAQWVICQDD